MNFKDLEIANRERCESSSGFSHALDSWRPSQWSNAMAGECGEVCNLTKKIDRHLDAVPGNKKPIDVLMADTAVEIGDVIVYADLLAQRLGFSLEECVRAAFNGKSEEIGSSVRLPGTSEL